MLLESHSMKPEKINHYIEIAQAVALMSRDERTKVGAVVIGPAGEIRTTGYNGQPRGCNDANAERQQYPLKSFYFAHAEENAIANAARVGTPLAGSTIVVTKAPCSTCMRMIINAGIVKVYAPAPDETGDWAASCQEALRMAKEACVSVVQIICPFVS